MQAIRRAEKEARSREQEGPPPHSLLPVPFSQSLRLQAGSYILAALHTLATAAADPAPSPSPADIQFFENRVRPVLAQNCYSCHSRTADRLKGALLLDSREGMLQGGNTGPAIVPGNPDESLLIQAVRHTDEDLQMPQKSEKLADNQIADLAEWVRRGAPYPAFLTAKGGSSAYGGVGLQHWAFQPVRKTAAPGVKNAAWCRTPVDNFILQKLEANGMAPNPPADKRTLIRRVTFDLTGLPPTDAEVDAFLADDSPDAFARVVDRLLASPHYGEQWSRYWLDVARYADTKGDPPRRDDPRYPHAWTYRDYVIEAFNEDKPYDRFIVEQIAADRLLYEQTKKTKIDASRRNVSSLAALGFLALGNQFDGRRDDIIADQIDVTTKAFLGLTVACARCHDHKFDPVPQKDYYSLYGVFANSVEPKSAKSLPTVYPVPRTPALEEYFKKLDELEKQAGTLQQEFIAARREARRGERMDAQKRREFIRREAQLQRQIGDLESSPAAPPRSMALFDVSRSRDYPLLVRGEAANKGDIVPRRFLECLSPDPKNRPRYRDGSGRLELARDIASPANPLTARVLVNRIWQQHFGAGIVATPDDLGNMSSPPTHPELLDWLAATFMEQGWSIKQLHRLILLSSTYQQSCATNPRYAELDPENKLHWRFNLRRLDFEELHDALLAISGALDGAVGGRSMNIGSADFAARRALYTYVDRANPPEIMTQFDFPNPNVPSGRRYETIVPQQSLFLMNGVLVVETARTLAHRPGFLALQTDEERVTSLYLAIFQRPPTAEEIGLCLQYVKANPRGASTETPPENVASRMASRAAQMEARRAEMAMSYPRRRAAVQVEPGAAAFTTREPLDAWTKLAHALLQSNEAMFLN